MTKIINLSLLSCIAALAATGISVPAFAGGQEIGNDLGKCTSSASGPAVLVTVTGFKNTKGTVRVQAYQSSSSKWLKKGAWINRIETPVSLSGGSMRFCVPLPAAGSYGIAVRHDADANGKSGWNDGGGFTGNPDISLSNLKPDASKTAIRVGNGVTRANVVLNYRHGLSIEPIG